MKTIKVFAKQKDAEAEAARNTRAEVYHRIQYEETGKARHEWVVVIRNRSRPA